MKLLAATLFAMVSLSAVAQDIDVVGTYTGKYNFLKEYKSMVGGKDAKAQRRVLTEMSRVVITTNLKEDFTFSMTFPDVLKSHKGKAELTTVSGIYMVRDGILTLVATRVRGKEYMDMSPPVFKVSKDGNTITSTGGFGAAPFILKRSQK